MLLSCSESAAAPPDDPGPAEQGDWQYHPGSRGHCQTGPMRDPRGDLGALLRSWRDRLSPVDVGLPAGDSRRAAGLRREGPGSLADVSVDYLVRLEQGRARRPSAQVAASLARALQLSDAERDHLFVVAGLLPPSPGDVAAHIPPGVQRLVARLGEIPLAVFTASWDLLTWSPLWAAPRRASPARHGPAEPLAVTLHRDGPGRRREKDRQPVGRYRRLRGVARGRPPPGSRPVPRRSRREGPGRGTAGVERPVPGAVGERRRGRAPVGAEGGAQRCRR